MTTALDEFANTPRRFRNADGSEFVSSGLVVLGPGITAYRAPSVNGETTFLVLDAPLVAALHAKVTELEARVYDLENPPQP